VEPRIRRAGVVDARAIARVHVTSWQTSYAGMLPEAYLRSLTVSRLTSSWRRRLVASSPRRRPWVAVVDGTTIGFCVAHAHEASGAFAGWVGEVGYLYVHPVLQARGVGTRLLQRALGTFEARGYRWVVLSVLEDNLLARQFYERRGLRFDGNRWRDRRLGAPVLQYAKALNPVVDWAALARSASSRRPPRSVS
jgi:ribosomal protein S18 acetylase RimI-like enzyme